MNYWLMKSEPSTWSWNDQLAKGEDGEGWDGVRNHQASNNMKAMEIGDLAFFYHSVNEKQIVGIVEVIALYHPEPTDASGRFGMVTVKAVKSMKRPTHHTVSLHTRHVSAVTDTPRLAHERGSSQRCFTALEAGAGHFAIWSKRQAIGSKHYVPQKRPRHARG